MEIQYKSILILGDYPENSQNTSRRMIDMIVNYFCNASLQDKGYQVSRIQIAKTIEEANEYLRKEYFDILYTQDMVAGIPVGVGKIKKWKEISPKTRTILMMKTESRGGRKVQGLYDIQYYDGCFFSGFNLKELNKLILCGRTPDMAQRYYGLQPVLTDNFTKEKQGAAEQVQNQVPLENEETDEKRETVNIQEQKKIQTEVKKEQNSQPEKEQGKQNGQDKHSFQSSRPSLTFCKGKVVSVLSDKTVIIETSAANGLKVGDIVAVPQTDFNW
ncbi:MAG: hypothetical protein IJN92_08730 [Lachnospiraceae bacterium]|nr:hypothetical protein [Lachnospiraceae bacterium]